MRARKRTWASPSGMASRPTAARLVTAAARTGSSASPRPPDSARPQGVRRLGTPDPDLRLAFGLDSEPAAGHRSSALLPNLPTLYTRSASPRPAALGIVSARGPSGTGAGRLGGLVLLRDRLRRRRRKRRIHR